MALVLLLFKHLMGKFRHFHKTKLQQEWYIYKMTGREESYAIPLVMTNSTK